MQTDKTFNNYMVRGTAADGDLMYFSVDSTKLVAEAGKIHGLSPLSTVVLGRTLTAAALMGQELKGDNETVTVRIKGNGPAGTVLAVSNSCSEVKGYIDNTELELPPNAEGKFDVAGAVGREGTLAVIRDLGLKEPCVGQVELISGEIAEDFAYYYAMSQQTPSIVALGVLIDKDLTVKHAGGFMVQVLPGARKETVDALEGLIAGFPPVTYLMEQGFDAGQIMDLLLGRLGFCHTAETSAEYRCGCSRERMAVKLLTIGKKELESLINDDQDTPIELVCQFCGAKYAFPKDELRKMCGEAFT